MEALRLLGPENDYRDALKRSRMRSVSVAVVIPAYNRPERLRATLEALVHQSVPPSAVVVADDGSSPSLEPVADSYANRLPISYVRRDDDGFGAGQARNLGTDATTTDVLIFIDSDCIADPSLVERHQWWHERATGLIVIGSRLHVEGDNVDVDDIGPRFDAIRDLAINVPDDGAPDDWRGLFYRRNRSLQMGDSGFRAVVSSNMSIEREVFDRIGQFPQGFTSWGGEDTELGWRAWNDGCFIVAENDALVYHQLEPGEDRTSRMASLEDNRLLIADRIPNRFYRTKPGPVYSVPQASVILSASSDTSRDDAIASVLASTFDDLEIVLDAPDPIAVPVERVVDNDRLRVAGSDLAATIRSTRGEFVVFVDGRVSLHPRLLDRAMRSFRVDPRISAVRAAYAIDGAGTFRRLGDLGDVDRLNTDGRPVFAVIRRRELMKELHADGSVRWERLWARVRMELLLNDTVTGVADDWVLPKRSALPIAVAEVSRAGAEESARTIVRAVRARGGGAAQVAASAKTSEVAAVPVRYIGWTGHDNFGDEALLEGVARLVPWASVEPGESNPRLLMLGGGTLINSDGTYLRRVERLDSPRLDRVVFGTGVRDPEYWGTTEPIERWFALFDSAVGVWLRGPRSERTLREAGYAGRLEVIGDPALVLAATEGTARVDGRVLVSLLSTGGECWGGDDRAVFRSLADTVASLVAEGRDVAMFSAHPKDDRHAIEVMRAAGSPALEIIHGYANVQHGIDEIAKASLVVGERLHSIVLAAAVGTPFVGLEYRPKVRDFAASLGSEHRIVRTDQLDDGRLKSLIRTVEADTAGLEAIDHEVRRLRDRLGVAAAQLHQVVTS